MDESTLGQKAGAFLVIVALYALCSICTLMACHSPVAAARPDSRPAVSSARQAN